MTAGRKRNGPLTPRRRRMIGTIIASLFAVPVSAQANAVCESLRAELRQPVRVIGNTAEIRMFANALTQQNIVIRRIKNDQRAYGCSSGSIVRYGNPNANLCAEIGDALAQAEGEREMITQDRDRALSMQRDDRGAQRDRIMVALEAEGCLESPPPDFAATDPYREGDMRDYADPFETQNREDYAPPADMPIQGGLRTLCVRTCDGAFFPIASNATPLDFRAQAAQCERMCPGTETELFYHSLQGQESSDMVSAKTGQPYTSMPTAFAYKNSSSTTRSPSCSCNMAAYQDEMKGKERQAKAPQSEPAQSSSSITAIPAPNSVKEGKPEVQASAEAKAVPERDYDPNNTNVRIVGPTFLPEETSRIDLKNPALKGAQPQQE